MLSLDDVLTLALAAAIAVVAVLLVIVGLYPSSDALPALGIR